MTVSSLSPKSFLGDVSVYRVDAEGRIENATGAPVEQLAMQSLASGSAEVSVDDAATNHDSSAAIAIPVHRWGRVVSIAVLSAKRFSDERDDLVGVLEVWHPVGAYDELALKSGFYGRMERFRNVSSFVRFEKGSGLPGQVWQQRSSVIHHDLSNHPGFLRAAGTSADLLVTAVGIPVAGDVFHSAALLISSTVSPLARGFEVWRAQNDGFELVGGTYSEFGQGVALPEDAVLRIDSGLPSLAAETGGAVLCEDPETIFAGRNQDCERPESACALAIPFYEGDTLTSVTALLF